MTVNDVIHISAEAVHQLAGQKLRVITRLDPEAGGAVLPPDAQRRLFLELVTKAAESQRNSGVLCIATERVELSGPHLWDWPDAPSGDYVMISITAFRTYENHSAGAHEAQPDFEISNVLKMVRSSGGQLKITTERARYTTLQLLLPGSGGAASLATASSKPRSNCGSETILLAGPHPEVRAHLRAFLLQHGYAVLEAVNGKHAEIICGHFGSNIDLVLLHNDTATEGCQTLDWFQPLPNVPVITLRVEPTTSTRDDTSTGMHPLPRIPCGSERLLHKIRVVLKASRPTKTILIVDDDESTRRAVAELLEEAGYEVSEAANGKEALRSLARRKTQLVLTELVMPEADGLQLIQQLRKSDPEVRVIAMSGASRAETYLSVARILGARATLQKPLPAEQLLQTVPSSSQRPITRLVFACPRISLARMSHGLSFSGKQ